MKKILEVLQYGDLDIRFNTDIDPVKTPDVITDIIIRASFTMMTKLCGGNEQAVLAMIRALAIADLGVSVNREQMIRHYDQESAALAESFLQAKKEFERSGGKMMMFGPNAKPVSFKN